jgi:catalase
MEGLFGKETAMEKDKKTLTTGLGMPVDNDFNSITAGPKGPALIQDVHLVEKLAGWAVTPYCS